MAKFLDIALPLEYFQKQNCYTPQGYYKLSKSFYFKGSTMYIQQDLETMGSWIVYKGIGDNGLPNKLCEIPEKNDYREGVNAVTGVFEQQVYNGTIWVSLKSPINIAGTACFAYLADGITLTGSSSINLRIECTNPDASKTAYKKLADVPNENFATNPNFQEITTF